MRIKPLHIILAIAVAICVSCSEDKFNTPGGDTAGIEAVMPVTLSPKNYGAALSTRTVPEDLVDEGTGADNTIDNLWLIEFDNNGTRIGTPRYFADPEEMAAVPVIKPEDSAVEYTLVAIANVGNDLNISPFASCSKLSDLWKITYYYSDESCGYVKAEGDEKARLVMNGSQSLNSATNEINIPMYRNVAKITVNITNNAGSGVKINRVRLCKVPSRISYADQYVKSAGAAMADNASVINLPAEEWNSTDGTMSLLYYVPRNMQGDSESREAYTKNNYAPLSATYFEVLANVDDPQDPQNGTALRYRFFLGKDMKGNFDVEPNYHYTLPVVISGKGDADLDSRVESFPSTDVMEDYNSYILYYDSTLGFYSPTSIPLTRINYFWSHRNITDKDADKYIVHSDTKWVAQVIWQDSPNDIFHFCNHDGSEKTDGKPHFYYGTGTADFMTVKATGNGPGNVIIGVRKADSDDYTWDETTDGYMWSWHLWVTDYNPNYVGVLSDSKFNYPVDGGSVHRYDSPHWKENLSVDKRIYIMDRNFGAWTTDKITVQWAGADYYKSAGFFLCFGRKDLFPYSTNLKLYRYSQSDGSIMQGGVGDGSQNTHFMIYKTATTTLENSVRYPNRAISNGKWLSTPLFSNWSFINTGWDEWEQKHGKSLFDPTPKGWRLPLVEDCPSLDNFKDTPIDSYGVLLRLDNSGDNSEENLAYFPYSKYVRTGYSGDTNFNGSGTTTNTPKAATSNSYSAWNFLKNAQGELSSFSKPAWVMSIENKAPTRLIRDPSQD